MIVRRIAPLAPALLLALVLAGCASGAPVDQPGASATAQPAPPTSVAPTVVPPPTVAGKGSETLSGTVAEGVEKGCLILRSADSHHVLVFPDATLRAQATAGSSITVTGHAQPGQMSYCQQGVPFVVTAVRAN